MPKERLVNEKKLLVAKSCPIPCDPMDCSLPGSSVHGISQARILEWVAMPSSKWSSWPRDQTRVSCTAGRFLTIWATSETPKKVWWFLKSSQWRRSFKGKQKSQKPKEMIQRFAYANIKKKNSAWQIPPWAKSQNKWQTENKYLQHIPQRANLHCT